MLNLSIALYRLSRFEYWNFLFFYFPLIPLYIYYSLKARSIAYMCSTNPGIEMGGLLNYSKYDLLKQIPQAYKPRTFLHKSGTKAKNPRSAYPFILKPNMGERGMRVEKISSQIEEKKYLANNKEDLLCQEFIDYKHEYGLFYARNPKEKRGRILSITSKELLTFQGDNKTSVRDFILSNPRAFTRRKYLLEKHENRLNFIPKKGKSILLEPIGNHCRGTIFFDSSNLINPTLEGKLDLIAKGINEFYYGRFDVKARSEHDLKQGEFIILEVNGSNSEATHIYSPKKFSLEQAYLEVAKYLKIQYEIAVINHKRGYPYLKTKDFIVNIFKYLTRGK